MNDSFTNVVVVIVVVSRVTRVIQYYTSCVREGRIMHHINGIRERDGRRGASQTLLASPTPSRDTEMQC